MCTFAVKVRYNEHGLMASLRFLMALWKQALGLFSIDNRSNYFSRFKKEDSEEEKTKLKRSDSWASLNFSGINTQTPDCEDRWTMGAVSGPTDTARPYDL